MVSTQLRVVMMVANDVTIDVRVRKSARSVSKHFPVTVLGLSPTGSNDDSMLDGFSLIRVAIPKEIPSLSRRIRNGIGRRMIGIPGARTARKFLLRLKRQPALTQVKTEETSRHLPWNQVLTETSKYAEAMLPVLRSLDPDVVHAQDVHLLSIAADYVAECQAQGKSTKLIYDAHEYIRGLGTHNSERRRAYSELEDGYIGKADRVITVSTAIAQRLKSDHKLTTLPTLVLNAPEAIGEGATKAARTVREVIGISKEIPLVVYSGGIHVTRGMETLVNSLEFMPDVHIAMTSNRQSWYLDHLKDCALKIGAGERLHFVPYVEPEEVVSYLSAATIGISPLPADVVNYDLALPNKLFDYMQAKLPIVVSNCVVAEQVVYELGIGEAFEWNSAYSLSEAVQKVIADPIKYAKAYATRELELAKYTWRAQEHLLLETYFDLLVN